MRTIYPRTSTHRIIPARRAGFGLLCALALCCLPAHISRATLSQPIIQQFFVPMPEADLQTSLNTIDSTGTKVGNSIKVTIAIVVGQTNTIIVYDQWEDGYENDLNNPTNSSTLIWGDGNLNTPAPGYPSNILPAGAVILLTNVVTLPRNPSVMNFDGRDRIGASKPVVVTRAAWGVTPGTVLTSASSVYDTTRWGTNFMLPVGTNVNAAVQNFSYSAAYIMASQNGTVVQIDRNGDGVIDQTNTLSMGQNLVVPKVSASATITSSKPVQVHEVTGRIGSTYQSRSFSIRPMNEWSTSYHAAAGTTLASEVHNIFLFNPYKTNITVQYQTAAGSGSFVVTNGGNDYKFPMPLNSGANFYTTNGVIFYAVGANDSGAAAADNQTHDWGYALQPDSALTTVALCGWSPGSDDTISPPTPDANGSPVWVTPLQKTVIYVNYSGNPTNGPFTAPNGQKYNTNYTVAALNYVRIYNPTTKNMTGARIFTTDGTLFTTVWGEDSAVAGPGNPYLDCGLAVLPFPTPTITKSSSLYLDKDNNGVLSVGDTLQYTITVANQNTLPIFDIGVVDNLPTNLTYVANSTTVGGSTLSDNSVPPALTRFPLDESGIIVPSIPAGGTVQIQFLATINGTGTISNSVNGTTADGLWNAIASTVSPVIASNSPTPTCNLVFSDSAGNPVSSYAPNAGIYVTVTNNAFNLSAIAVDTVTVLVKNDSNGDQEYLTLTETGVNTGVFRNIIALPSSTTAGVNQQDGTLYAQSGQQLEVDLANSICTSAYATVTTPSATKKLYLDSPNQILDRVDPVATGDTTTTNTVLLGAPWYNSSWSYRKMITIDHTKVGSGTADEANFPVLINLASDSNLAAHALASGNDILFTASDGATVLSYEREKYTSGTGALVAWVKVPTLSHTADTVLYVYYGNSGASDQQNKTAVWDSNFKLVYHLGDAGPTTAYDSTTSGNNGTQNGGVTFGSTGQIDGATTYNNPANAANQFIATASQPLGSSAYSGSYTYSLWVDITGAYVTTGGGADGSGTFILDRTTASSPLVSLKLVGTAWYYQTRYDDNTFPAGPSGGTFAANTWTHIEMVRDFANNLFRLYVNGAQVSTVASDPTKSLTPPAPQLGRHATATTGTPGVNGLIDEFRISGVARSADWIATEYTNQFSPSTFYSLSAETPSGSGTFTQSPAFCEPFTMPSSGAVSVRNYASVPSGSLSANPTITATLNHGTTTFATLSNPTATQLSGGTQTISAVAGSTTNFSSGQTVSSLTTNYNSGSTGSDRILMVGISYRNNATGTPTVSSVTYGGQTLTQVGGAATGTSGQMYIFSLLNPPTGANNLVVTWSAALSEGAVVGAVTYAGVSQAAPTGFVSATGSSTTPSVTVTSGTGQLVFGVVAGRTTSAYTPAGLWSAMPYSGQTAGASTNQVGASPSVTLSWTGSSAAWVAGGVSLQQAYDPLVYQLDWSTTLGSAVTVPSGEAISLTVANGGATPFSILYDSSTYPSSISLPATTTNIISVGSLALYTAPYPSTSPAPSGLSGQTLYLRATVSDPFGAYDVNHLNLTITDPANNVTSVTLSDAQVVASDSCSKTYEYPWFAGATIGNYLFQATAYEGTEGNTNSLLTSIYVGFGDPIGHLAISHGIFDDIEEFFGGKAAVSSRRRRSPW